MTENLDDWEEATTRVEIRYILPRGFVIPSAELAAKVANFRSVARARALKPNRVPMSEDDIASRLGCDLQTLDDVEARAPIRESSNAYLEATIDSRLPIPESLGSIHSCWLI